MYFVWHLTFVERNRDEADWLHFQVNGGWNQSGEGMLSSQARGFQLRQAWASSGLCIGASQLRQDQGANPVWAQSQSCSVARSQQSIWRPNFRLRTLKSM